MSFPPPLRRRPGRGALLCLLIPAALLTTLALFYLRDSPPRPGQEEEYEEYPAITSLRGDEPTRTNGWAFLHEKLRGPRAGRPSLDGFLKMRRGGKTWNDDTAWEASRRGESLAWLEEAAAMPEFLVPSSAQLERYILR